MEIAQAPISSTQEVAQVGPVSPTAHLAAVVVGVSRTVTPTAAMLTPVPEPNQANALLSSPLQGSHTLPAAPAVLLATPLPRNFPATLSVAGVSLPSVRGAYAVTLASRLSSGFATAAQSVITDATISMQSPFSVVGPWNGGRYRLTVNVAPGGYLVNLTAVSLPQATSGSVKSVNVVAQAINLMATLGLAHDNLMVATQGTDPKTGIQTATFAQTVDNLPVIGHSAAQISVDSSGRLLSLYYTYVVTTGSQSYPLRNPVQALADLNQGNGLYTGPALISSSQLEVQSIRLAYVGVANNVPGQAGELEPIYVFTGTAHTSGSADAFTAYVPALAANAYTH